MQLFDLAVESERRFNRRQRINDSDRVGEYVRVERHIERAMDRNHERCVWHRQRTGVVLDRLE